MEKMWQGRFHKESSKLLEEFNASILFDKALFNEDIAGSKAHAQMLANQNIITKDEAKAIIDGLDTILQEIKEEKFRWNIEDEDIHMAVERRLSQIVGKEIGGKLHTARSRNDQVALDFKSFVMKENLNIAKLLLELIKTLKTISSSHKDSLMPGFTHLQHAQPVSLAFYLLAYAFMFKRDFERFNSSYKRNNLSPLGSAALAGTPHPIDRFFCAKELGFDAPTPNAMDSVSDRDFALEILFNIAVVFMHTSRLCEELILWSSAEFGYITIGDEFSTGSSIMPQKKNPDVAELIRGKTGRAYGNLMALFTTMKSLPLAYNKDMQEDKEGVFDSVFEAKKSLIILTEMLRNIKFNKDIMLNACKKGHLSATDLADYLVRHKGVPFREAHFITGRCVALAEDLGKDLSTLTLEELKSVYKEADAKAILALDLFNSKEARKSYGGTANESVEKQLKLIDEFLKFSQI